MKEFFARGDETDDRVRCQAGIGTYTAPKIATPFMSSIRKVRRLVFFSN